MSAAIMRSYHVKAQSVVTQLLELNVINVEALDRQLEKLARRIVSPQAEKWFRRVVRYWVINLDLMQGDYVAKAEPRSSIRSAKGYVKPSSRMPLGSDIWQGEPPGDRSNTCEMCKGFKWVKPGKKPGTWVAHPGNKYDDDVEKCPSCKGTGTGEKVYSHGTFCDFCLGSGLTKTSASGEAVPAKRGDSEALTCDRCHGTGLTPEKVRSSKGYTGFFTAESYRRRMFEAEPGYDPVSKTYSTSLHTSPASFECPRCRGTGRFGGNICSRCNGTKQASPLVASEIAANYLEFDPAQAKEKSLFRDPPAKSQLPAWMSDPTKNKARLHFFSELGTSQKHMFQRLLELVQYLNYSYKFTTASPQLTDQEKQDLDADVAAELEQARRDRIVEAKALFRTLETAKTEDLESFRKIMMASDDFAYDAAHDPAKFMPGVSGAIMRRRGDLALRKCWDVKSCMALGDRDPYIQGKRVTWCLKIEGHASSYMKNPSVFYVDKGGKAYVAIHTHSNQARNVDNSDLSDAQAREIAPILVNSMTDLPTQALTNCNITLGSEVRRLRRQAGLE